MSCTDRFWLLITAQNSPIGKSTQKPARISAPVQCSLRPRKLTTRSPIRWPPKVRPVVAQETQKMKASTAPVAISATPQRIEGKEKVVGESRNSRAAQPR